MAASTTYSVYFLRCADGSLYAGSTTDTARRVQEHNGSEKGARYTHMRRPVTLVYEEACGTRSDAQKREAELKKMTRAEKETLILRASLIGGSC